ncbi:nitrogenase-stabilizing/protective protein NifW [Nodosilinea nodulosa]|uniref:nitrogenase-stabilizing/protective protein NifW n=1 Tax=Nodosilinea nodulosa TaxID=416001 RepID=UPI000315358C|nr:nitrogenase-stabilizing/protective protein NifW [Nodosilinea nodulosa]
MTTATLSLAQFNQLKDAEEYLEFFGLSYDPQVVNINRLHILRKFSQLVQAVDKSQSEAEVLAAYSRELRNAYDLFVTSSSVEQKLFKVFQDKPKNVVLLSDIEVE